MAHFNLRYFCETLEKASSKPLFVLQIGAMDGRMFDPLYEYISRYGWHGLLVEPVPEHYASLRETYRGHAGLAFANVAIAEHEGTATLHTIPAEHREGLPPWACGAASFYRDRNALAFDAVTDRVAPIEVPCTTLPALLSAHGVERIDLLQIDAEGYDYHVLKQLDFTRYRPWIIHMEIVNLPKAERKAARALMDRHGYLHAKAGYDLLAVRLDFFAAFPSAS